MTSRSVRPKVLRNLRRLTDARHSATVTATDVLPLNLNGTTAEPPKTAVTPNPNLEFAIDFDDTKLLFKSVKTPKLCKSLITLLVSSFGPVADFGSWVMKSDLMANPRCQDVVLKFVEKTFYQHFCAGKDFEEASKKMEMLWKSGLTAMLDYGLEHANDNQQCDDNLEKFTDIINRIKFSDDSHVKVSFVVVKTTAVCPPRILRRVSDLLRWQFKDNTLDLPWKLQTFPVLSDLSPFYHTPTKPDPLTLEEERDLERAYHRFFSICKNSTESGIPLLIDAEDTSIQPAIDYFTYSAIIKYSNCNSDRPLIYNTIQAYLKDAGDRLWRAYDAAVELRIPFGIKLVRGAYMSRENKLAASLGVDSPIHDSLQDCHTCYDTCATNMIDRIPSGTTSVILATHNAESARLAATRVVNQGIDRYDQGVQFAQLYGMSDSLSFGLQTGGFRVSKYLPFGPVDQIMPYLLRRAEENKGLLGASSLDRTLIRKELIRRLMSPGS